MSLSGDLMARGSSAFAGDTRNDKARWLLKLLLPDRLRFTDAVRWLGMLSSNSRSSTFPLSDLSRGLPGSLEVLLRTASSRERFLSRSPSSLDFLLSTSSERSLLTLLSIFFLDPDLVLILVLTSSASKSSSGLTATGLGDRLALGIRCLFGSSELRSLASARFPW